MIVLIGVGHVFNIHDRVRQAIINSEPEIVCVELDPARAEGLLHPDRRQGAAGKNLPAVYQMLAIFQRIVAGKFESEPGMEMVTAIQTARELNAKLEFIDIDAVTVAERIWREMSFVERMKLIGGLFFGIFLPKKKIEKTIDEFNEKESDVIEEFGKEFPTIKKILIDDRNDYMAWRISMVAKEYTDIVCVVGEGHIEGISKQLSCRNLPHRIVRLKDLLTSTNAEYSWSWAW
ncbi:MAG: TraB/GumN family protein [Thermoplasmata archaeon]|nr:TraB/GumN family protein [Thermoplasmata archaeon]